MHTVTFKSGTLTYNPKTDNLFRLWGIYSVAKDNRLYATCNVIADGIKKRLPYEQRLAQQLNIHNIEVPELHNNG